MTFEAQGRSLADFTVELDVYSGPYEWLLALILKDELEIFEIPLRELVESYIGAREKDPAGGGLERDTDFAGSASASMAGESVRLFSSTRAEADPAKSVSRSRPSPVGSLSLAPT